MSRFERKYKNSTAGIGIDPKIGAQKPLSRYVPQAFLSLALLLQCGGYANAEQLSCAAPTVHEWLRKRTDTEIAHIIKNRSNERAEVFPDGTYELRIATEELPEVSYYRNCRGTITIEVAGGIRASTAIKFDLPRDASSPSNAIWDYAPFNISQLIEALRNERRAAATKDASQKAVQTYDETRAKGTPFCPSWLDEKDNRQRVSSSAYWIAQNLRHPIDPQEALSSAQSTLTGNLGLYGEQAQDAKKMTEADFVACTPEIGKLLVENDRRHKEDVAQRRQANEPLGQLLDTYKNYLAVKQCAESRAAYEIKYIQDSELDEAKDISKLIEQRLTSANPSIDKDKLWDDAQADPTRRGNDIDRGVAAIVRMAALSAIKGNAFTDAGQSYCRASFDALRSMKETLAPETHKIRKDF